MKTLKRPKKPLEIKGEYLARCARCGVLLGQMERVVCVQCERKIRFRKKLELGV